MAVNNLVTKAEYKTYVGINSTNQDTEIDSIIPKVSALVKAYCRRTFIDHYSDPKSERFNGGVNKFLLQEYPLVNLYSVEYSSDYGQNYTLLSDYVDFAPDLVEGCVHSLKPNGFEYAVNGYIVTYSAGYSTLPVDLKLAVFDLVTYYRKNDSAVHSNKAPSTGNIQVEYINNTAFPAHIRRVLDLYVADFS